MAIYVLWMGYSRLKASIELPTNIMFISAIGGLITELISMAVMWKGSKNNLNMKGAFWHVLQTFVGSIIIIIAAVVIKLTGWYPIDPILGMLFGLVLFVASISIIKDSFDILLESAPKDIEVNEIVKDLENINNVNNVHHVHAWALTSDKNLFIAHLKISRMNTHEQVLEEAYKLLKLKYDIYFSTLQVEENCPINDDSKFIDYLDTETKSTNQGHEEH